MKNDFKGFNIKPEVYTLFIILIAGAIGVVTILRMNDMIFGLVFLWALFGILLRHMNELKRQYPIVIYAIIFSMVSLTTTMVYQFIR